MRRIVVAYSGGLDSSAAIARLKKRGDEVVAVTLDLGQGHDLEGVRNRALALGAVRAHVLDQRDIFARQFVVPALKADALYHDRSPMASSLARPPVAKALADIARIEQTQVVAHGGGKSGRRSVLDVLLRSLDPSLQVLSPARDVVEDQVTSVAGTGEPRRAESSGLQGRHAETNLWGRTIESDDMTDAWIEPPEDLFTLTRPAIACPDEPAYIELSFDRGVPSAVSGVMMPVLDLIGSVGTIAAAHGVGRVDVVDHRSGRTTRKEIAEAPAAVLLHAAHQELRRATATPDLERFSRTVSAQYAEIIYSGRWFSRLREALDAFVESAQSQITGSVRLKLFKGGFSIVGRSADLVTLVGPSVLPRAKG